MSTNPIVTILVPVHGASPFLAETLRSLERVTYKSLEILFILDRPGTKARELTVGFCHGTKNARFLESTKPGISAALNLGIQKSNGELIARLDADDLIMPPRIEIQVGEFHKDQNLVLIGTQMRIIDSKGNYLRYTAYPMHNREIKKLLKVRNCLGHPSVMYRKSAVELAGGYRSEFNGAEDLDLWLRLAHEGRFKIIDLPLTEYRVSDFQQTKTLKKSPGALEEKVVLSNWEMSSRKLSSSRIFSKTLCVQQSENLQFTIPIWKVGQLKCIRSLWVAETAFEESTIKGVVVILKGCLYSPITFIHFARYLVRIKFNSRGRRWK